MEVTNDGRREERIDGKSVVPWQSAMEDAESA
jgi:hypothetical protein